MYKNFSQAQSQFMEIHLHILKAKEKCVFIKLMFNKVVLSPLHFHEAPLTSYIEEGQLTLKTKKGKSTTFREGGFFVLSADTPPHTMANNGKVPTVMWVTVAADEGVPTLTNVEG